MNPTLKNITYDLQDLYNYLDTYVSPGPCLEA